ncbi:7-cyano-7-deazaguanine synthase [Microbacterium sp. ISL-103]|uniref:7-cyano-7-deazaguanine synthase n=1 Tax=Microbacterium sp. ISL-103 TaxID=2819156 RepID=UPI001BED09BC|nr:7-cyano-7-deazaguanine synthase [Microbacterium sp. ISL-103]
MSDNQTVLLLSGGLDSAALAAWKRPALTLFVDYGQKPRDAEARAARAVAAHLDLPFTSVTLPLSDLGGGLMHDDHPLPGAPSPEWWPFRNQFLATAGAAVAVRHQLTRVVLASVRGDGDRHVDGSLPFYERLDAVTSIQEGEVRVAAPAIHLSTVELLREARAERSLIGWTVSCHRANRPCGDCPGCWKRELVLADYWPSRDT